MTGNRFSFSEEYAGGKMTRYGIGRAISLLSSFDSTTFAGSAGFVAACCENPTNAKAQRKEQKNRVFIVDRKMARLRFYAQTAFAAELS